MTAALSAPEALVAASIRVQLEIDGFASGAIEDLPVTVAEWRRLARQVAHDLDFSVSTSVVRSEVHARIRA